MNGSARYCINSIRTKDGRTEETALATQHLFAHIQPRVGFKSHFISDLLFPFATGKSFYLQTEFFHRIRMLKLALYHTVTALLAAFAATATDNPILHFDPWLQLHQVHMILLESSLVWRLYRNKLQHNHKCKMLGKNLRRKNLKLIKKSFVVFK